MRAIMGCAVCLQGSRNTGPPHAFFITISLSQTKAEYNLHFDKKNISAKISSAAAGWTELQRDRAAAIGFPKTRHAFVHRLKLIFFKKNA